MAGNVTPYSKLELDPPCKNAVGASDAEYAIASARHGHERNFTSADKWINWQATSVDLKLEKRGCPAYQQMTDQRWNQPCHLAQPDVSGTLERIFTECDSGISWPMASIVAAHDSTKPCKLA